MIVDDHHCLIAVLAAEAPGTSTPLPQYLDARVPAIMHLRLVAGLHKPRAGRLTRALQGAAPDPAHRFALLDRIATPQPRTVVVLDDRPLAAAIGALTAEPGVSIATAALIAHAQHTGQPILIDPANEGRWMHTAEARRVEVIIRRATTRSAPRDGR